MRAAEDDPTFAARALDYGGCPVGIFADNSAPTCELWAIFPVMFDRWRSRARNRDGVFVNASIDVRVEVELYIGEIETSDFGFTGKNGSRAYSEIVQAVLDGVVNVGRRNRINAIANMDVISARNDQEAVRSEL